MRKFDIPGKYRSSIISEIKRIRKEANPKKDDFSPTELNFGPLSIYTARHFGFCYGVENAIETVYRIMAENTGKSIYLLSEMIHNPRVNQDLEDLGIKFIQDTKGNSYISWDEVSKDDIVVIPAFGTTIEIEEILKSKEIPIEKYDTTCPFVGRVWKRSDSLGKKDYTIIIHGKIDHEETRATFSHASKSGHAVIVQNMKEAQLLMKVVSSNDPDAEFEKHFKENSRSSGFVASKHLSKVGVVNQTTMLATETKAIAEYIKNVLSEKHIGAEVKNYFADTRDTLCYATSDNQESVYKLLDTPADLAIVVGGYKSANTTHLVELCEKILPTYFISSADKIDSRSSIQHFDRHTKTEKKSAFLPEKEKVKVLITSGASCPDAVVDEVIQKILSFYSNVSDVETVLEYVSETAVD